MLKQHGQIFPRPSIILIMKQLQSTAFHLVSWMFFFSFFRLTGTWVLVKGREIWENPTGEMISLRSKYLRCPKQLSSEQWVIVPYPKLHLNMMMNWLQKQDEEECEKICITKNHKSSLVQWAPYHSAVGLSEQLQGKTWEGKGSLSLGLQYTQTRKASPKFFLRHHSLSHFENICWKLTMCKVLLRWKGKGRASVKMKIRYQFYCLLGLFRTRTWLATIAPSLAPNKSIPNLRKLMHFWAPLSLK